MISNPRPFSPTDALRNKVSHVPSEVIQAVNELLTKHYRFGKDCKISVPEIYQRVLELNPELTSKVIQENGYLEIEPIYSQAGWVVIYSRPSYDETGEAKFTFCSLS